jgi:TusA-related sulfurtransferase
MDNLINLKGYECRHLILRVKKLLNKNNFIRFICDDPLAPIEIKYLCAITPKVNLCSIEYKNKDIIFEIKND